MQENCFPGDSDWDVEPADGRATRFATAQSIDHGGSVDLKVRPPRRSTVDIEIFRSGYYGGAGARLFSTILDVPVDARSPAA